MSAPAKLLRSGASLLVFAMVLGFATLIEPTSGHSRPWFNIVNWTVSLLWLAAGAVLIAAALALLAWPTLDGPKRISLSNLLWTTRIQLALAASWACSLPHAYLRLPHYNEALPLYLAGIGAYATGNALAAFFVCLIILLFARKSADRGIKFALAASVLVNAALLFASFPPLR